MLPSEAKYQQDIYSLWNSQVNVLKMLKDRKYSVIDENPLGGTLESFRENHKNQDVYQVRETMTRVFYKKAENSPSSKNVTGGSSKLPSESIIVMWMMDLGVQTILYVYNLMQESNVSRAIVIVKNKITPHAQAAIRNLKNLQPSAKAIIETFPEINMQFNVTEHEYVPRHIICSTEKRTQILETYAVTKDKIPQIKSSDPVVRWLDASRGQLIKIVRPSESTPSITINGKQQVLYDITYRLVV
jgi:DNA-directed RNA polymerases I, II, and III subunit RPABC1